MARRGLASDPLRNFKFIVTIAMHTAGTIPGAISKLGFQNVTGWGFANNEVDYREGGDNTTTRKMPGQTTFNDVSLAQGIGGAPELGGATYTGQEIYDWSRLIFSAVAGGGLNTGGKDFRAEIAIDTLAHPITEGASYAGMPRGTGTWPIRFRAVFTNAWIKSLQIADLDATANSVLIHTMTFCHEGMQLYYTSPNDPTSYLSNTTGMSASSSSSGSSASSKVSSAAAAGAAAGL